MVKRQMMTQNPKSKPIYSLGIKVRDYECDMQSIVNHSVYFNYLEHTRHEFLASKGTSFLEWQQQGKDLVVVQIDADFKKSLRSGDCFESELYLDSYKKASICFHQIIRIHSKVYFEAKVRCACIYQGKVIPIDEVYKQLFLNPLV